MSPRCACVCDHKYIDLYKAVTRYRPIVYWLYIRTFIVLSSFVTL